MRNIKIVVRSNLPRKQKKKLKKQLQDISGFQLIWMIGEPEMIELNINSEGGILY